MWRYFLSFSVLSIFVRNSYGETTLDISFHYSKPFVSVDENGMFGGIEYKLLNVISDKIRINIDLEFKPSVADLQVGAFYLNSNLSKTHRFAYPYLEDKIGYCIRLPEEFPRWQYLFLIADSKSPYIWSLIVISAPIGVIMYYLLSEFEANKVDIHLAFLLVHGSAFQIGVPYEKYATRSTTRFLASIMIFCQFFNISIYNAFFFNLTLMPKFYPKVTTVQEIFLNNYELITSSHMMVSFIHPLTSLR